MMQRSGAEHVENRSPNDHQLLFIEESPSSQAVTQSNRTAVRSQIPEILAACQKKAVEVGERDHQSTP
jgi:hypothetical protein